MKQMMKHVLVVVALAALMACGGKKIVMTDNNTAKASGVMSLTVGWVKDKGKKFDINFTMRNESESKSLIVYLHDLNCYRGTAMGEMRHKDQVVDFRVGQSKTFTLVCRQTGDAKGAMRLNIAKVYDNPSNDGRVPGKVIATNIDWKSVDSPAPAAE